PLGGGVGTPCQVNSAMSPAEPYAYPATAMMPGAPALPTDAEMPQGAVLSTGDFVAVAVSNSPLISSLDSDPAQGIATAGLDLFESNAFADGDGNSGNGNSGSGNQGGGQTGSQGGSTSTGNNGSIQSLSNTTCANPSTVWMIDSSRKLVLGKVCN